MMNKIRGLILLGLALVGFNALAISAPSITSCTRTSSTSVSLAWTSVSGASYYVVKRSWTASSSSASTLGTPSGTTYTDSQAGVDTCYYWVEAWDSSGAHAISGMATAASGSGGGGSSGGSFTINASDGTSTEGVIITWSAQSGATGYRVVRGNSSNMDNASILVETVTGTSYTDTTAVAGKTYYYWIVAKKSSGYVTSSSNTGYRASSSSGGSGSGSGSGSSSGSSYDGQSYSVKFNANGGTGTMANESFVYGTAKALTINTFTRTGYTFVGWATSASATTSAYDDGQSVSNLTTTSGGTVNLYAVWQANAYTIKFNKNGGTGTMANLAMTYDVAKALTANAFQRVNYKFMGWATSASATTATYSNKQSVSNLTATPDGTVNLYAVWKLVLEVTSVTARQRYPWNGLVDIDVTFAASGLSTVSFEVKDTKGNTNLNARTFYVGNPSENNRTLEVQPGTRRFVWDAFADLGQVTLSSFAVTAKVTEKNFQVNVTGGTGSGSFIQGKSVTISAASKTGYTFASWSGTTADTGILASATSASTTLTIPSRDVAYEATYTPNTYTVKFNANGGSGSMNVESFTYDTAKALTANAFTRKGWTFKGWADTADATTAKYTNGQTVKNLATSGTKNLYAVWWHPGVQLWENGPFWAECNVGATTPEESGYYFWWGDTVGYKWQNSQWVASDGSSSGFNFKAANCPTYNKSIAELKSSGYINSSSNLAAGYDAATQKLGSPWRIPTRQELIDLKNNTTFVKTIQNGVDGYLFTGVGSYASRSIFLPLAGCGSGTQFESGSPTGYCYGSTARDDTSGHDHYSSYLIMVYNSRTDEWKATVDGSEFRYFGNSIRPVISANQ
ncbi:MAG: InlB B-repeat-containing protein [Kiritimatiellae bacterium]|nr:InlB B-repeat-containing protein [Kiritimatiellia bacterium]MBQ3096814.1 InlB B-repeat-containing protein [Kiritimatiellia bacterium]